MSSVLLSDEAVEPSPQCLTARKGHAPAPRRLAIGLLGCGNVGQALVRACESQDEWLERRGLAACVTGALVRDIQRDRNCATDGIGLTDNAGQFFAREYDVVIDALCGPHPAFKLVSRCLRAGVPVVTANKSLLAAHGEALFRLAVRHGTKLRCEASALAGVPFLGALRTRPLAARVNRIAGILNGTSHFVLSAAARNGVAPDAALRQAQRLGLADPDAGRDLSGRDAADKLIVILQHLGIGLVDSGDLEVVGLDGITPVDLAQAAALGGAIKPVVCCEIDDDTVRAFVGPAFVGNDDPLARLANEQNGLRLGGPEIGELFYSGPGAGPDITAGTLLDDAIETASHDGRSIWNTDHSISRTLPLAAPDSAWFVRLDFPGNAPPADHLCGFLGSCDVWLQRTSRVRRFGAGDRWHILTHACSRAAVERALGALHDATDCDSFAIRAVGA